MHDRSLSANNQFCAGDGPGGGARGGGGAVPVHLVGGGRKLTASVQERDRGAGVGASAAPKLAVILAEEKEGEGGSGVGASINAELLRAGLARVACAMTPPQLLHWCPLCRVLPLTSFRESRTHASNSRIAVDSLNFCCVQCSAAGPAHLVSCCVHRLEDGVQHCSLASA